MNFSNLMIILMSILVLSACGTTQQAHPPVQMPGWILTGSDSGSICYVGSSRPHIKGLPYQKALAVSRSIDGIARQKDVKVDVQVESLMKGTSSGASTTLSSYSVQTTTGQKVSAKITDVWMHPYTSELFVRMCEK